MEDRTQCTGKAANYFAHEPMRRERECAVKGLSAHAASTCFLCHISLGTFLLHELLPIEIYWLSNGPFGRVHFVIENPITLATACSALILNLFERDFFSLL